MMLFVRLNYEILYLCNKKYDINRASGYFYMNNLDIKTMLEKVINSEKIDLLLKEIKDRETIEELKNIKVIIELIEKIVALDVEELKKIASNICELWKNDNENYNTSYQYFFNIENIVKRIYGVEVSEKSTKISDLNSDTKGVIFEKGKYKPTMLEYKGEKVSQDGVDYIQLDGMPFTLFTHVLNGFGYGGDITYFKEQKLIGKSHICLSAINDKHVDFFNLSKNGNNDISGVTLIFSNLPPEKLVGMNHEDMGTQEDDYRRIYSPHSHADFGTLKDIMNNTATNHYNEYVYNRDGLYPSGVLVSGNEPTDAEINAAAYLKVPLVKINVEKYKYGHDNFVENKENEDNKKKIEEYRQLKKLIEETSSAILEEGGRSR